MTISQKIKKILIIRLSSLGDIILSTHLPRAIRTVFKDVQIDFMTTKIFSEVLNFNPNINNVILYDKSFSALNQNKLISNILANGKYDVVIDLQNNIRSNAITKKIANNIYKLPKHRIDKFKIVKLKSSKKLDPIPERYLSVCNKIGVKDDFLGLDIFDENSNKISNISINSKTICIAPGAAHNTKKWNLEKYANLSLDMIHLGFKIILLGSKNEIDDCNFIENKINQFYKFENNKTNQNKIYENLCGKTSILELSKLISQTELIISNDSGIAHIAAAVNTPQIVIFGSTVTNFGFEPWRNTLKIIETELKCRPCTHIGREFCPEKHFNCMNYISKNEVLDTALNLLHS